MNKLSQKIETLLFYKNQPLKHSLVKKTLGCRDDEYQEALLLLKSSYKGRGFDLVDFEGELALVTHSDCTSLIEELTQEERSSELSKQAMETLSIILYNPGITKSELDYIRGVNSVFILRNLLVRGLIVKKKNEQDKRSPRYNASLDTLSYLGVHSKESLPNYEAYLEKFKHLHEDWSSENTEKQNTSGSKENKDLNITKTVKEDNQD